MKNDNKTWLEEHWLFLLIAAQPLLDTLAYFTQNKAGTVSGYIRLAVMLALPIWALWRAERKKPILAGLAVIGAFCLLHVLNGFGWATSGTWSTMCSIWSGWSRRRCWR